MDEYPIVKPRHHTMRGELPAYIAKIRKGVPSDKLEEITAQGKPIEIHGIYDGHIELVADAYSWDLQDVWEKKIPDRSFKFQYPRLYKVRSRSRQFYVLTVFPGRDYIDHVASLVKNYIAYKIRRANWRNFKVFRYPQIEKTVYSWSGIKDSKKIRKDDIVLVGYGAIPSLLYNELGFDIRGFNATDDELFTWIELETNRNHRVLFFGFAYNFWGSILGRLAEGF